MVSKLKLSAKIFKHKITFIENKAFSEIETENWEAIYSTYSEVIPLNDKQFQFIENINFGHIITGAYFLFRLRFLPEVNLKMRILYNQKQYEIKRIINLNEENRYLQLITLEI